MSEIAIRVDGLGKQYRIGRRRAQETLREKINRFATAPFRGMARAFGQSRPETNGTTGNGESFWALKDVSFEVKQGEVVGIIGRNGAGKSTLLKILSRITEPTTGQIELEGRVASLLEVGTGFHPELTGRENVFLNGAILGMTREEIRRKFDEIVAFAEVERFIDTAVKHYSSGMYMRLAFAVAAHLEPEILVVDEVLAVGDAQFQKKCLGKMSEVAKEGRTVLFVSHNMAAIGALCQTAVILVSGQVAFQGNALAGIENYLIAETQHQPLFFEENEYGIRLVSIDLVEESTNKKTAHPIFSRNYDLRLILTFRRPIEKGAIVVRIRDGMGTLISSLCSAEEGFLPQRMGGKVSCTFFLHNISLLPRTYTAGVYVYQPNDPIAYLQVDDAIQFEVQPSIVNDGMWPYRGEHGYVRLSNGVEVS
jgi:lipopolysaccharide transport system ATP-binding protein